MPQLGRGAANRTTLAAALRQKLFGEPFPPLSVLTTYPSKKNHNNANSLRALRGYVRAYSRYGQAGRFVPPSNLDA